MDERNMLSRVVEKHVDDGIGYIDPIVDSWRERLIIEKKKIFCCSLYQADIDGRRIETVDDVPAVPEIPGTSILSFQEAMEKGFDNPSTCQQLHPCQFSHKVSCFETNAIYNLHEAHSGTPS